MGLVAPVSKGASSSVDSKKIGVMWWKLKKEEHWQLSGFSLSLPISKESS